MTEASSSIEGRARFHIEHLDEYWMRCLGFLQVMQKPVMASFLLNDLFTCVRISTELATKDIESFCSKKSATNLDLAWKRYLASYENAKKASNEVAEVLTRSSQRFGEVRDMFKSLIAAQSQAEKN